MYDIRDEEYLEHYGVRGMRWGVHKATIGLSKGYETGNQKKIDKSYARLDSHRQKATDKINKLSKKNTKLESVHEKQVIKAIPKADKYRGKAVKLKNRAYNGMLLTNSKRQQLLFKSDRMDNKADIIIQRANKTKNKIASNKKMIEIMNSGINSIDKAKAAKGREFIKF